MIICHVCMAECEDSAELCPVCGADLTVQESEGTKTEEIILNNPVLVASVDDVVSAEIFKDLLRENKIPFTGDDADAGTLKVTFGGAFVAEDIYVDDSDFEKASEIYDEFLNSESEFEGEFFEDEESVGGDAESEEEEI